jgi:hypothetical protein
VFLRSRASLPALVVLPEPCSPAAHELHELVVDHADQRLARREAAGHLLAERLLADAPDEILDDGQARVRIEQGEAHLAHHLLDVLLGEP